MQCFDTSYLGLTTQLIAELTKITPNCSQNPENYITKLEGSLRLESKKREQAIELFNKIILQNKNIDRVTNLLKTSLIRKPDSTFACIDTLFRVFTTNKLIDEKIEKEIVEEVVSEEKEEKITTEKVK